MRGWVELDWVGWGDGVTMCLKQPDPSVFFHLFAARVVRVGNELIAAEAGVDVPGTVFILQDPVPREVRRGGGGVGWGGVG